MDLMDGVKNSKTVPSREDDEAVYRIRVEDVEEGWENISHCLVGKVLTSRTINREVFKRVMEQIWGVARGVDFESKGSNMFTFTFRRMEDRARVWSRGPWHFDRCLVAMEKPMGMGDLSRLEFNKMKIWVQLHNVPLLFMNRKMARMLASQIGRAVEVLVENRECRGSFVRVKVEININCPLKRELKVALEDEMEVVVIKIKYEKLPDSYFVCGRIGHVCRDCPDEVGKQALLSGEDARFGSWMRTSAEWRHPGNYGNSKRSGNEESRKSNDEQDSVSGVGADECGKGRDIDKDMTLIESIDSRVRKQRPEGIQSKPQGVEGTGVEGRDEINDFICDQRMPHENKVGGTGCKAGALGAITEEKEAEYEEGSEQRKRNPKIIRVDGEGRSAIVTWEVQDQTREQLTETEAYKEASPSKVYITEREHQSQNQTTNRRSGRRWKRAARNRPMIGQTASPAQKLMNVQTNRRKPGRGSSISPNQTTPSSGDKSLKSPPEAEDGSLMAREGEERKLKKKKLSFIKKEGSDKKWCRVSQKYGLELSKKSAEPIVQVR